MAQAKIIPSKSPCRPVGVYYFGNGKGKTTAALGAVLRAAGYGRRVLVLQFIKGDWVTGEIQAIRRDFPDLVTIKQLGKGFVGIMGDKLPISEHIHAAKSALTEISSAIRSQMWDLIILDELTDLITLRLVDENDVIQSIQNYRDGQADIIVTGHHCNPQISKIMDIVTEMKKIKHHYDNGIIAKRGLDY